MESKIFKKSVRYLIVSTLLIMAFTRRTDRRFSGTGRVEYSRFGNAE